MRVMKIDGLPINEDQIDFRMRHAARFDHILDRRLFAQAAFDPLTMRFRSEEKIKVSV